MSALLIGCRLGGEGGSFWYRYIGEFEVESLLWQWGWSGRVIGKAVSGRVAAEGGGEGEGGAGGGERGWGRGGDRLAGGGKGVESEWNRDKGGCGRVDGLGGVVGWERGRGGHYNAVPPPPIGLFSPPNLDLSYYGLEEFQQLEFEGYGPKPSKSVSEDTSNEVKESSDAPLVEELVSDDKLEKKTVFPTVAKIEFVRAKQQEKPVRKPVKYAEMYRSQSPRGNQRNWNNQKSQQLRSDFVMYNKACFVCESCDLVQANCNYHQRERVVSGNNYTRAQTGNVSYPADIRNLMEECYLWERSLKEENYLVMELLNCKLDFEDVYFVKELQFNLFSVSQMCDKKNSVLFTDTGCFVLVGNQIITSLHIDDEQEK
ncbi:hypothetical protein Tco_1135063 [Tanacetum coccineum]